MPESVRTATQDRWPLGSRWCGGGSYDPPLRYTLNLAEALGRLTLSPLTFVGMASNASLREMPDAGGSGRRRLPERGSWH